MTTAEQNYRLLQEIEANRKFLLMAYQQNPKLLENTEARIRQLFEVTATGGGGEVNSVGVAKQRGISLVELIMFIVIVSVALAGILLVFNVTTKGSADPLIHKQALAAAESLLEEIQLQDFSNPPDGGFDEIEPTQGNRWQFDDVMDYNGFEMPAPPGIFSMNDSLSASAVLASYSAIVAVSGVTLGEAPNQIQEGSAVLITVTVTVPQGTDIEISGYRTAY